MDNIGLASRLLSTSGFRRLILWLFCWFTRLVWQKFERALKSPRNIQTKTLATILAHTHPALTLAEFQQRPLCQYEDLEKTIIEAKATQKNFLTHSPPFFYESTSGSSGTAKLIPYNLPLLRSFTHLFLLWSHDVLWSGPRLRGGRIYFSVSPQFQNTMEGLDDDSNYLRGLTGFFFRFFVLVPAHIKKLQKPEQFYHILSLYFLAAEDLEVISVWSPGFLLALLAYIQTHRLQLIEAGQKKTHSIGQLSFRTGQMSRQVKTELLRTGALNWTKVFPALRLISCWGAQNSAAGLQQLQSLFPHVYVQEKGLLATEAPLSFPSVQYSQFLPLLDQVYFEFLTSEGQLLRLDELELEQCYELVISQKSGLLRYRLGDYVKVTGKVYQTPCFHFIGRAQVVSDLVGEKINEHWLGNMITHQWPGVYLCLIPDLKSSGYGLFSSQPVDAMIFETELMRLPHYYNARSLNQLNPLQVWYIPDLSERLKDFFCDQRYMKRGDIKEQWLYSRETDGVLRNFLIQFAHTE